MNITQTYNTHSFINFCKYLACGWLMVGVVSLVQANDCPDLQPPEITSQCMDKKFCQKSNRCEPAKVQLRVSATDDQTPDQQLNYQYKIDLDDDGQVNEEGFGQAVNGDYPPGKHRVYWTVSDACGNSTACEQLFIIRDCEKPKTNCINGKSLAIQDDKRVTLKARDLSLFSTDNCAIAQLQFHVAGSIHNEFVEKKTFGCSELGMQQIELLAEDLSGNQNKCVTYVYLSDPKGICTKKETITTSDKLTDKDISHGYLNGTSNTPNLLIPNPDKSPSYDLLQNTPNPFSSNTTISFFIPESSKTTITIFDVSGRVLQTFTGQYEKGLNELSIKGTDLPGSGVYYYELSHSRGSMIKRMLKIDGKN